MMKYNAWNNGTSEDIACKKLYFMNWDILDKNLNLGQYILVWYKALHVNYVLMTDVWRMHFARISRT